jgi:hypothetical protein
MHIGPVLIVAAGIALAPVGSSIASAAPRGAPAARLAATEVRTATIEIVERSLGGAAQSSRYVLVLAEDGRSSRLESDEPQGRVVLTLASWQEQDGRVLVRLDIDRQRDAPSGRHRTSASLTGRVALGRRVLLGRLQPSGGTALEIMLTVR